MARDVGIENHRSWLGYLQPVGLVVSPHALVQCQAYVDSDVVELQRALRQLIQFRSREEVRLDCTLFPKLFTELLGWRATDLRSAETKPDFTSIFLPEYQETITATHYAQIDPQADVPTALIRFCDANESFDDVPDIETIWKTSLQARFERLLRERGIAIGMLIGTTSLRLVFAPKGETSGFLTFPYQLMLEVQGRLVLSAFKMLFGADRWFTLPTKERLPALLSESRKYQNVVSTMLSEQVLAALFELLRGIEAADSRREGQLLRPVIEKHKDDIYHGCLTVLLRIVFLLYAEDRDLIPAHNVYVSSYSIKGLFDRLRSDESRFVDTMDQRFGAWAQLLTLFRVVYEGIDFPGFKLPPRRGHLFDPNRFPFLEGRAELPDGYNPPLVADGVVLRVLRNLMLLDGERISYRTLDVEQIGSVYETVMGFRLEIAEGPSIAIKAKKTHGAPIVINLETLLSKKKEERAQHFKDLTEQEIKADALKNANTLDELEAALDRRIARQATPRIAPKGSLILQPNDERRRSGSHYTPRALTAPIVKKALEPLLNALGTNPNAQDILNLKICDPAMGSGAFLVEATRQLSEALVKAWRHHKQTPTIPPDEDELLFARRLVAQRCIYGVDKNPMAVDLAKLSLWLATFARDHAFTFLDHSLKQGDSLVGLSLSQLARRTWEQGDDTPLFSVPLTEAIQSYLHLRKEIQSASEERNYEALAHLNSEADQYVARLRFVGDMILSVFFKASKDKERKQLLVEIQSKASAILQTDESFKFGRVLPDGLSSFHWELEYPEVFQRDPSGFDALVGNPPFLGGSKLSSAMGKTYLEWLGHHYPYSHGKSDLVSYFFRAAFDLCRSSGSVSLLATNSIRQGDTRATGLEFILKNGGCIYSARTRLQWPGIAAVIVALVHITRSKSTLHSAIELDGRKVGRISSYLFHMGPDDSPSVLVENTSLVHSGTNINGKGFVLSQEERDSFVTKDRNNLQLIRPYLGGEEMNESPLGKASRFIIYAEDRDEDQLKAFPDLYRRLHQTVRIQREGSSEERLKKLWWRYSRPARDLYQSIGTRKRILASGRAGSHLSFIFQSPEVIFSDSLTLFLFDDFAGFALLQSRVHEVWARFFGSSLKDDFRYIPEDCFATFPIPANIQTNGTVTEAGNSYYTFRAQLMERGLEGLTTIYNRFHDPDEQSEDILRLRELHSQMDRAILNSFGWADINPICGFDLEYEEDTEDSETGRNKKKPWRFRWQDSVRDDVLARLLNLNAKLAEAERLKGTTEPHDAGSSSHHTGRASGHSSEKSPRKKRPQ